MPSRPSSVIVQVAPAAPKTDSWLTPTPKHFRTLSKGLSSRSHTPGLQNLGNTCFLNAALQCLLHTPLATILLLAGAHSNFNPTFASFCAWCALQSLAKLLHRDSTSSVISPKVFAQNARFICSNFQQGRQEDAHEFVRSLLDGMTRAELLGCDHACHGDGVVSWKREMQADVHKVFGGILESRVACRACLHVSVTTEPFLDISLEIARVGTIEKALERFTAEEVLQGDNRYRCEGCTNLVVAAKRFSIRRAPNVLTLHLKRFDRNRKDSRFIQYPEVLDLAPFMIGRPKGMTAKYSLTGVLVHQGSTRHYGHYFSYVKGSNDTWYLKDDSTSRTTTTSHVLKQRAYLLFYTRIDETPITPKSIPSRQSSMHPMDIVGQGGPSEIPPLNIRSLQDEAQKEDLVLSEESSSEDEYKPAVDAGGSEESGEEEVDRKVPRRKPAKNATASPRTNKPNVETPSSPTKSAAKPGFVKRISGGRRRSALRATEKAAEKAAAEMAVTEKGAENPTERAADSTPGRKGMGPMARRMEGKAKQSNAEAAKKATESMKDHDPPSLRRFLGAGTRGEKKSTPRDEKSRADRTLSEPSLPRKILGPLGRRLSSNSAEQNGEGSPEPARRRFFGNLGRKPEPKTPERGSNTGGESSDETEPSDRTSSSADDEEATQGPTSMREVLISGGTAVRKVMHRVFGVGMPSPHVDKKRSADGSPASSPRAKLPQARSPPPKSTQPKSLRPKASSPKQARPKSPISDDVKPSEPVVEATAQRHQGGRGARSGTSTLFGSEGVDKWNDDAADADGESRKSFTRSRIVKRRRANDVLDAEYDRGKAKKSRTRYNQSKLKSNFAIALERRRRSDLSNGGS